MQAFVCRQKAGPQGRLNESAWGCPVIAKVNSLRTAAVVNIAAAVRIECTRFTKYSRVG